MCVCTYSFWGRGFGVKGLSFGKIVFTDCLPRCGCVGVGVGVGVSICVDVGVGVGEGCLPVSS